MSRISDLGDNFRNLDSVLSSYDKALDEADEILSLKGKTLEQANKENPAWQVYYDQKRVELKTLVDYLELQVQRVRSRLFKNLTQASQHDLSDRAKDKYIDGEKTYLDAYEIYLEVKDMYDKYQAVVNGFTSRGYALNNITKIRVAALEDVVL